MAGKRTKFYDWTRQPNGRYTIRRVEVNEPHNYDGDVFDRARVERIHRETAAKMPVGTLFIGHNSPLGGAEQPLVGRTGNYDFTFAGRTVCDFLDIEPPVFLDIALDRYPGRSLEFEYPSFRLIEGVALLGSSRQFFQFPDLRVKLTDSEMARLRQEAKDWPAARRDHATSATTAASSWRRYDKGDQMKVQRYRQAVVSGKMQVQVAEIEKGTKPKDEDWRALREGEAMPMNDNQDLVDQLSDMRAMYDELAARVQTIEDGSPDRADDDGDGDDDSNDDGDDAADRMDDDDDDKEKDRAARRRAGRKGAGRKSDAGRAALRRVKELEATQDRAALDAMIDSHVARGAVVSAEYREAVIKAALAEPRDKRRAHVDTMLASVKRASTRDTDGGPDAGGADNTRDADGAVAGLKGDEAKDFAEYLDTLPDDKARREARKLVADFVKLRKAEPMNMGVQGGPTHYVRSTLQYTLDRLPATR